MSEYNSILIKVSNTSPVLTSLAEATITPGMILIRPPSGFFRPHDNTDSACKPIIAVEDYIHSKTIDDDYSINDLVMARCCRRGDIVLAFLASNETIVIGDLLTSNGDGMLKKSPPLPPAGSYVATALEAVAAGGEAVRIKVEIE